jgi:glycerophosphoryl diester phosphodiesterase
VHILAHRGASHDAPENTLEAFALALAQGVDGIEFDVHFTGKQAWVIHDTSLQRTHGQILPLSGLTPTLAKQFNIPTLTEALEFINGQCLTNIEIKSFENVDTVLIGLHQVEQYLTPDTVLSSFNHHILPALQNTFNCRIGALSAHKPIDYAAYACALSADICAIADDMVDAAFVRDIHARGMQAWVYTVDSLEQAIELNHWGVDAIFSNRPHFLKQALTERKESKPEG